MAEAAGGIAGFLVEMEPGLSEEDRGRSIERERPMSTATVDQPRLRTASKPFYFNTSEHLLRIGREKANTLSELLDAVRQCPPDSIFQHTFCTLQEHHF